MFFSLEGAEFVWDVLDAPARAVILGGFGMQPKHCQELESLYRENQICAVTPICHSLHEMTIFRIGNRRARELAGWFNAECVEDKSVIHLFSGSVFIFGLFLTYLTDQARNSIQGVVFESSPMDCQAEQFGRFLCWRLGRPYARRYVLPFSVLRPLMGITPRFEKRHQRELLLLPKHTKFHFIHCDNDPVINMPYVESYSQTLRMRGHDVSMATYADARHCRALTDCPADYRVDLRAFLDRTGAVARHHEPDVEDSPAKTAFG